MIELVMEELQEKFDKTLESLRKDLGKLRTGRANVNILDGIRVPYYGSPTPLNQVAAVNVADARLITVKPWEKALLTPIEKAIIAADIGITPSNDGELIRLPIPPLTTERRKDLVKMVKKAGEEAKVALRNSRREANDDLRKIDDVSEDLVHKAIQKVQESTDKHVARVDEIVAAKEKEILEV
jgi:ribosome recycling factor